MKNNYKKKIKYLIMQEKLKEIKEAKIYHKNTKEMIFNYNNLIKDNQNHIPSID